MPDSCLGIIVCCLHGNLPRGKKNTNLDSQLLYKVLEKAVCVFLFSLRLVESLNPDPAGNTIVH